MPPLTGVAVKVMLVPGQILLVDATIETLGVTFEVTTMVMPLLVAVGVGRQAALLVITTVIISPLVHAALM